MTSLFPADATGRAPDVDITATPVILRVVESPPRRTCDALRPTRQAAAWRVEPGAADLQMHGVDKAHGWRASTRSVRLAAGLWAGLMPMQAHSAADTAHAARCTAALQIASDAQLAAWARDPSAAAQTAYELTLRRGSAFIAQAFMAGNRDEGRAKEALADARAQLKALPQAQLEQLQNACVREADALLANAGALQRWLLERVVQRHSNRERDKAMAPKPDAGR